VAPAVLEDTPRPGPQRKDATVDTKKDSAEQLKEATVEEELLAAVEASLRWFERYERHSPSEATFGGEAKVVQQLRRSLLAVYIRDELS
jgi:hypothetical protein